MNGTNTLERQPVSANSGNPFPWAGQPDETACNYAFGNLIRNLPPRIALEGKLHAPTVMAAFDMNSAARLQNILAWNGAIAAANLWLTAINALNLAGASDTSSVAAGMRSSPSASLVP